MKKFVFITIGFEPPTPEIMADWMAWFESIKDNVIEKGHLPRGLEISKAGKKDLPMDLDAITGFMLVEAESFEEATKLAETNPFITSIRIYELMSG